MVNFTVLSLLLLSFIHSLSLYSLFSAQIHHTHIYRALEILKGESQGTPKETFFAFELQSSHGRQENLQNTLQKIKKIETKMSRKERKKTEKKSSAENRFENIPERKRKVERK